MKISELIEKLEEIREKYGDLNVEVPKDGFETADLSEVNIETYQYKFLDMDLEYEYVELL